MNGEAVDVTKLGGLDGVGDPVVAMLGFVVYLALLALLAAVFRASGLQRNGLIEDDVLAPSLTIMLEAPRRFVVALGTWSLAATVSACVALARLGAALWPDAAPLRFYLLLALGVILLWSLGGVLARRLGARHALTVVRSLGRVLLPLDWLCAPWTTLLVRSEGGDEGTLWTTEATPHLSDGEIRRLISRDDEEMNLESEEREMIESIFGFHETTVKEIMIPRIDVVSLESNASLAEAVRVIGECRHSRIPLHDGSVDRVTGLLYAKDLLGLVGADEGSGEERSVGELSRPAYFVPESKKLDDVLEEFRTNRIHMAVVIDEYGGTAGLVTLEDVLEEIVGEIEDEFDEEERLFEWLDERTLRVDPKIDLDELQEILGVELPLDEGSETLAGLVYDAAGKVPEAGDEVEIAGLFVRVEKVEDQRITMVRLASPRPLPGAATREDEG